MAETVRIAEPEERVKRDETVIIEREMTSTVSYRHVPDEELIAILKERGVKVKKDPDRKWLVAKMMGSEPGAHVVRSADDSQ